jgi:hypothetical protein
MKNKANLFGLDTGTLPKECLKVEAVLGIPLVAHESDYHGGEYFKSSGNNFSVVFQENFVEDDGEHTEAAFPTAKLLLYITGDESVVNQLSMKPSLHCFKLLRSGSY